LAHVTFWGEFGRCFPFILIFAAFSLLADCWQVRLKELLLLFGKVFLSFSLSFFLSLSLCKVVFADKKMIDAVYPVEFFLLA
jgi:hypothetical protein